MKKLIVLALAIMLTAISLFIATAETDPSAVPAPEEMPLAVTQQEVIETEDIDEAPAFGDCAPEAEANPETEETPEAPEAEDPASGVENIQPEEARQISKEQAEATEDPAEEVTEETADSTEDPAAETAEEPVQPEAANAESEELPVEYATVYGETEVRLEPDTESKIIDVLKDGTRVAVLEKLKESAWIRILLDNQTQGYIPASSIRQSAQDQSAVPSEENADTAPEALEEMPEAAEADEAEDAATAPQDTDKLIEIGDDEIPQGAGEEGENAPESDDIFVEDEQVPSPAARKVTVYTSLGQNVQLGDTIYLSARLEGFEDCGELRYQWECNKGGGFAPVEGATSLSTSYIATAESLSWAWRLKVLYK